MDKTGQDEERDLERGPSRDLSVSPLLTVIVPVHNGEHDLEACLTALESSDVPRSSWELIVVDDASSDSSADVAAKHADVVVHIDGNPRGPAYARNRGIEAASSNVVAFVDADVMVHDDALRLMHHALADESIAAVFGSYDDQPTEEGIVSQYRNLMHSFVHQRSAGLVESFWAGCGAARKDVLHSTGLFDEERFRRPEMEDVELGYRLREAGHDILLDPPIQCTHRKRITLGGMIVSDFSRRGIPWTRLLIDRGMFSSPRGLSLGMTERLSAFFAAVSIVLFAAAAAKGSLSMAVLAVVFVAMFTVVNKDLFQYLARIRGHSFLAAAVPLHLLYSLVAISAIIWGTLTHPFSRTSQARYTPRR